MCAREATSREHAPPRCLFPEAKDVPNGMNYRRNLVTVPSCELHNCEKSHDDEYLLFVLSGSYTSSDVGLTQFLTKVRRAFERRPSTAANFVRRFTPVQLKRIGDAGWDQGAQVIVDGARLDSVLSNSARALYYYHTGSKFQGPTEVFTNFTMYLDEKTQAAVSELFKNTRRHLADEPVFGENSAVFSYMFKETESAVIFYYCFYESSTAIIRFKKILLAR
ncbi:hypothetical protein D3C71_1247810 [compost metagenome]|jgi:hypothetical protein